jgi:hypothetical protein
MNIDDDGYVSCDEIDFEITNENNTQIETVSIPYNPTFLNKKRLICFSVINKTRCNYQEKCIYAHSLEEQYVDEDKFFFHQIILDNNLMNFFSLTNPKTDEIYQSLTLFTQICNRCLTNKCTGGFNCRNGVCHPSLKVCKNDFLSGHCSNNLVKIEIDNRIIHKFNKNDFIMCNEYIGCSNGHHLTNRHLIPYYKYKHILENSKKNKYQSVRYIDINPLNRIFNSTINLSDSDYSTDEEISEWFSKKDDSD